MGCIVPSPLRSGHSINWRNQEEEVFPKIYNENIIPSQSSKYVLVSSNNIQGTQVMQKTTVICLDRVPHQSFYTNCVTQTAKLCNSWWIQVSQVIRKKTFLCHGTVHHQSFYTSCVTQTAKLGNSWWLYISYCESLEQYYIISFAQTTKHVYGYSL